MPAPRLPNLHVLAFKGRGPVALLVRLLTWKWWTGQKWDDTPAHVALFWSVPGGYIEIEAIVTGIRRGELAELPSVGVVLQINCYDEGAGYRYASQAVGLRYGFEAAAITGLASLCRTLAARLWASLASGRTAPLHCSLLALNTLKAAGYVMPSVAVPPSPNELMLWLKGNQTP
jgi:hypothetical protein